MDQLWKRVFLDAPSEFADNALAPINGSGDSGDDSSENDSRGHWLTCGLRRLAEISDGDGHDN